MRRKSLGWMVGVALAWCSSLQAATLCSAPGPQPDGIDFTDVSFNSIVASDCWGVVTGTATAANLGFEGFTAVAVNAKPDNVPVTGTVEGISFSLTASGDFSGNWGLSWSGGETPFTLDIVAVVQTASDTFASYLFNDLEFGASPGSAKGPWAIKYEVAEDFPVLSTFSIYAGDFHGPTSPEPVPTPVDEPGSLALLGAAALGLALTRRRLRRSA